MPSAAKNREAVKRAKRRENAMVLLDARDLDIFRVSAAQCALETYSQQDVTGSRLHFRANSHEVPRDQRVTLDARYQDPICKAVFG